VVDTVQPEPLHGGAVVLVDEDLNAASVRFYNESGNLHDYKVTVGEARHPGEPPGLLFTEVSARVGNNPDLFQSFCDEVAKAVHVRAQNIRARINRERMLEGSL
jgi:hypothetical protein